MLLVRIGRYGTGKNKLRETACIMGNVPLALLATGEPDHVKDYCTTLLDLFADTGGFILSSGGAMDDTRPENIRAMIESVNEYWKG